MASASTADTAEPEESAASAASAVLSTTSGKRKLSPFMMPDGGDREERAACSVASSCALWNPLPRVPGKDEPWNVVMRDDASESSEESSDSALSPTVSVGTLASRPTPTCRRPKCFMKAECTGEREESSFVDSSVLSTRQPGLLMVTAAALASRASSDERVAAERSGSDG